MQCHRTIHIEHHIILSLTARARTAEHVRFAYRSTIHRMHNLIATGLFRCVI